MVCIDSSIWISVWRQPGSVIEQKLTDLIIADKAVLCGQVWVELIGGFRSAHRRTANVRRLRDYPWIDTTREMFELAAEWVAKFRGMGPGDAIIAATAQLNDCQLFTLDQSFKSLQPEGLQLFQIG